MAVLIDLWLLKMKMFLCQHSVPNDLSIVLVTISINLSIVLVTISTRTSRKKRSGKKKKKKKKKKHTHTLCFLFSFCWSVVGRLVCLEGVFGGDLVEVLQSALFFSVVQTLEIVFSQRSALFRRSLRVHSHTVAKVALQNKTKQNKVKTKTKKEKELPYPNRKASALSVQTVSRAHVFNPKQTLYI